MSDPPEPGREIAEWLSTLRLSRYASCFQRGGYQSLGDCRDLTDERLLELEVCPTGHRRRILCSLEALGAGPWCGGEDEEEGAAAENGGKPVPRQRHIFRRDKKRAASCQNPQPRERRERGLEGSQSLPLEAGLGPETEERRCPPRPAPRDPKNIQASAPAQAPVPRPTSSSSGTDSPFISETPSDWDVPPEDPSLLAAGSGPGGGGGPRDDSAFLCGMVENSIYESQPRVKAAAGPRPTRSYRLRHRPVPEIPNLPLPPFQDRWGQFR